MIILTPIAIIETKCKALMYVMEQHDTNVLQSCEHCDDKLSQTTHTAPAGDFAGLRADFCRAPKNILRQ